MTFICYLLGAIGRQPDIDYCILGQVGQVEVEQLIRQGGRMPDVRMDCVPFLPRQKESCCSCIKQRGLPL